jgi:hypothetical protein
MENVLLHDFPTEVNTFEKITEKKFRLEFINIDYISKFMILAGEVKEINNPCDFYNFLADNEQKNFITIATNYTKKDSKDFHLLLQFIFEIQALMNNRQGNQLDDLNHNNENNDNNTMEISERGYHNYYLKLFIINNNNNNYYYLS